MLVKVWAEEDIHLLVEETGISMSLKLLCGGSGV